MKKNDLIEDADGRVGVVVCIILCFPEESLAKENGIVGFAFFFDNQKEEIIYAEEVVVIGEYNGTHILE